MLRSNLKNAFSWLALLGVCLFFFSACSKTPPRSALDAAISANLQRQLEALSREREQIPGISAFAQVKLSAGGRSELFDAALLARPPDKLYLQILDDLGQERARVVADGAQVLFFDAQENRYEQFPQNSEALKKTLKLPLSVEELIDRLLARLPPQNTAQWSATKENEDHDLHYWVRRDQDRLGLQATPLRLSVYEALSAKGQWKYRVSYGENAMLWTFRRPKAKLSLSFQSIDLQKTPPETRFDTSAPEGAIPR